MQKYKISNPTSVVEVSESPINKPDPRNPYTIYDCLCRGFGQNNRSPRKTYQITATSPFGAAQLAIKFYRSDFFSNGED